MGLINIIKFPDSQSDLLGIWQINETCEELTAQFRFTENENLQFQKLSSNRRKKEFLAVRLLLQEMMQQKVEIYYDHAGRPSINNGLKISIAHSPHMAVIRLSDYPSGIDVENIDRNTAMIAPRFLSEPEIQHINQTSNPPMTRLLYWCAKEALFKCSSGTEIEFRKHIAIHPFNPSELTGSFSGLLSKDNHLITYKFSYFIINNNVVVYCSEGSHSTS